MSETKQKNPFTPVLGKLVEKKQHALRRANVMLLKGREWLSPVQLEPPIGYKKQKSLAEQIREQVRSEALRYHALQQGQETFEEADDFDVDDDFDPKSPYEEVFEPPVNVQPQVSPGSQGAQPVVNPAPTTPPASPAPTTPPASSPPAGGQGQGGAQPPPGGANP